MLNGVEGNTYIFLDLKKIYKWNVSGIFCKYVQAKTRFSLWFTNMAQQGKIFPLSWHAINSPTGNNSIWIDHWGRCYATFYRWLWNIFFFFIYFFLFDFFFFIRSLSSVSMMYSWICQVIPIRGPNLTWILLFRRELCANFQVSRYCKFFGVRCWIDFRLSHFNRHSKISGRGMSKPDRWS